MNTVAAAVGFGAFAVLFVALVVLVIRFAALAEPPTSEAVEQGARRTHKSPIKASVIRS